ncbi:interferon-induced, double-stranded RNA-activated protein kinase isoform X5 [Agelaius phoeniceus]|uniref:interferon-induced, double-stranded RNA-activated protein kinase isoform X5 n=1 Tax=Agelaius phoeniceus TaxID=39638 RepID=UPI00405504DF
MDREYMTKINRYSQIHKCTVVYDTIDKTGPDHDPEFTVVVKINGEEYGRGTGKSIKEAKAVAAKETWKMIEEQSKSPSNMAAADLPTAQTISATSSPAPDKDYVSLLNIYSQRTGYTVDYTNKNRTGDPHVPTYSISCTISGHLCGRGTGPSLGAAKQAAAKEAYEKMETERSYNSNSSQVPSESDSDKNTICFANSSSKLVEKMKDMAICEKPSPSQRNAQRSVPETKRKVEREAQGLARLSHENIVRYHSSWKGYDRIKYPSSSWNSYQEILCLFIQMEFCEQGTLEEWIVKTTKDRKYHEMAQNKFLQIVKGVECIHSEKLIHRDLKPQNIFISHDQIKIGDFGLVTSVAFETLTENRGTRSYMAPEQTGAKYGKEVDIYALGLIWFEILSAITAHEKSKIWPSARKGELPEYFNNRFPTEASIIKKMLSTDPSGRITISYLLDLLKSADKEKALRNYSY